MQFIEFELIEFEFVVFPWYEREMHVPG